MVDCSSRDLLRYPSMFGEPRIKFGSPWRACEVWQPLTHSADVKMPRCAGVNFSEIQPSWCADFSTTRVDLDEHQSISYSSSQLHSRITDNMADDAQVSLPRRASRGVPGLCAKLPPAFQRLHMTETNHALHYSMSRTPSTAPMRAPRPPSRCSVPL